MVRMAKSKSGGFTLVELLVVIAIIGILVALLLPAVQAAREAARRMSCSNNLKQQGIAFHNYHDTFKALPLAWYLDHPAFLPLNIHSWGEMLLPFMEQQPLHDRIDFRVPALTSPVLPNSAANVAAVSTPLPTFICPSAPGGAQRVYNGGVPAGAYPGLPALAWTSAPSDYCAATGVRGVFANMAYANLGGAGGSRHGALVVHYNPASALGATNMGTNMAGITDGTSNTILVGERTGGDKIFNLRVTAAAHPALGAANGGGWGDALNGENWLSGTLYTGVPAANLAAAQGVEGPCGINCTNLRGHGFHSFHPGGAMFAMADGSVQFISQTASQIVLASRITREKGEITPDQ